MDRRVFTALASDLVPVRAVPADGSALVRSVALVSATRCSLALIVVVADE